MEETEYPTLRRPKRKLCYLASQEKQPKQWGGPLTLEDVDKMFDDLDSSPHDDLPPASPLRQTFDIEPNLNEMEVSPIPPQGPAEDTSPPATKLQCPKPDVALDIPFKGHQPVKTSSPIDQTMDVNQVEKQDEDKVEAVSPFLFPVEDEVQEVPSEPSASEQPSQKPQCNGQVTEESGLSELETPPNKVVLHKPSSHKTKPEASRRQEKNELPVVAVREEPEVVAPENKSIGIPRKPPVEAPARLGNDLTAFLKKLKEAGQSKVASSRKSVFPVKVPTPEPEEDFLILEDDVAFQFSIPSKNTSSRRQQQSKSSSSDKESSTDKATSKASPQEEELENVNGKLEGQIVNKKIKKKKKQEEKIEDDVTDPESKTDELLIEPEKPNKKKQQLQKIPSKESDQAESQAEDGSSSETKDSSQKSKRKAQKSSESRKPRSTKEGKANAKTSRKKPSKGTRKEPQGSDAVQEVVSDHAEEPVATEHLSTPPALVKSDSNGNTKSKQSPVVCESSSSEEGQVVGKRKRRPTGAWWMNCPQSADETDGQQLTVKKSKQDREKPQNVAASPLKETRKKDKVLKKEQKVTSPVLSRQTSKAKGRRTKRNQQSNTSDGTTNREEATFDVSETPEEEQHEVPDLDPDLDQEQSSPLVFTHRDHSADSAAPGPPRRPEEQVREGESAKRRRKPTGCWWMLNPDRAEDVESVSSQMPQRHREQPKPRKERKKPSNPGLATHGSTDCLSDPAGGAPGSPLKPTQLFPPKTVKRSLATFTDIFTTNIATPRVVNVRNTEQNNRQKVAPCPVEEKAACDYSRTSAQTFDVDDGEGRSPENDLHSYDGPKDSTSKILVSGPASMIELEEYDENDNTSLPSSRVQALLSVSDLCGPPLKPLTLQLQDKANMAEWFKTLWVTSAKNDAEITPDQFDWYFYQDKAMGLQEDQNSGPICTGKILLGSNMKKPLWVDHCATTVFHLFSSSVSVTIDGSVSHFGPGQSFIVHCGHAYSIKNTTKQPAVLCFTRILAESSD